MRPTKIIIVSVIALLLFSCTSEAQKKANRTVAPNNPSVGIATEIAIVDSDGNQLELDGTPRYLTGQEQSIFEEILQQGKQKDLPSQSIGLRVVGYGKLLLGNPYVDKTLEVNGNSESLVCNLHGFDCVTFFENAWTFARTVKMHVDPKASDFTRQLCTIRYRKGTLDGYASRLHYTTDYFYDNAERGNLREMTRLIGSEFAVLETKPINFMSTHPSSYQQLQNDEGMLKRIEFHERELESRGGFYYIKKENVAKVEKGIEDGDLIGITTSIPGIDCSHTGIAVRGNDGRIHLMHASSSLKKVIISDAPLADYLAGNAKQTGIIIYRPLEVESK